MAVVLPRPPVLSASNSSPRVRPPLPPRPVPRKSPSRLARGDEIENHGAPTCSSLSLGTFSQRTSFSPPAHDGRGLVSSDVAREGDETAVSIELFQGASSIPEMGLLFAFRVLWQPLVQEYKNARDCEVLQFFVKVLLK